MAAERMYWIKLDSSFFKRRDVALLESQENGAELLVLYFKLAVESAGNGGTLPFPAGSKRLLKVLAAESGTDIKAARNGIKELLEAGLLQEREDGTLKVTGASEMAASGAGSASAQRQRRYRARKRNVAQGAEKEENKKKAEPPQETEERSKETEEPPKETEDQPKIVKIALKDSPSAKTQVVFEYQKFVDAWNALGLKQIIKIVPNSMRGKMLRARVRDYGEDAVLRAIAGIKDSPFLRGGNDKGWEVTFEWFVRPNNFPKVLEGYYRGKQKAEEEQKELDPKAYKCAKWLAGVLSEYIPDYPMPNPRTLDMWAVDFNLIRESGYSWKQISDTLQWAVNDDFWRPTLVDGKSVRKHFTKMLARRSSEDA